MGGALHLAASDRQEARQLMDRAETSQLAALPPGFQGPKLDFSYALLYASVTCSAACQVLGDVLFTHGFAGELDNKKAKREKKLLRAGFEGRKAGFINAGKK